MTVAISRKCFLRIFSSSYGHYFNKELIAASSLKSNPFFSITLDINLYALMMFSVPKISSSAILKLSNYPWSLRQAKLIMPVSVLCIIPVTLFTSDSRSESSYLMEFDISKISGIGSPIIGRLSTFPLASSTSL